MNLKSKKTPLLILAITAVFCSRILFLFFNDPEGPNLLVVMGMAAILYLLSLAAYIFNLSIFKRLLLAILIQILAAAIFYLFLH